MRTASPGSLRPLAVVAHAVPQQLEAALTQAQERGEGGWCEAAQAIAKRVGVRVDTFRVGVDLQDPERQWPSAYGVKAEGAILVHPDGIVAWRSKGKGASPEDTLTKVLAQVLARPGTSSASEPQQAERGQPPASRAVAPLL